jgi:hypothetical protein
MNTRLPLLICVWTYCLSWAFDYRAAEGSGGSPVQYLFFAITLASALVVILLGFRRLFILPMGWLTLGWGAYMVSSLVVALVNHVEFVWYFRNSIPPLLLFTSLCVTQIAASSGLHWKHVLWPMLIASVVNVFWRIFYALFMAGIPLEKVRVELLSPCLPFLMGYLFAGLALSRRVPWLAIFVGSVGTLSYVLSITRSAVFILGAAGVGAVMALWQAGRLRVVPRGFSHTKMVHAAVVSGLLLLIMLLTAAAFPVVIERWTERLFYTAGGEQSSADPSALTRFAETKAFIHLLNQEPITWVYGRGLGFPYYWDESFAPELAEYTYGNEDKFRGYTADIRFPGHSIWTYAIFSGGAIGGLVYLGIFIISTVGAFRSARFLRFVPDYPMETAYLPFICLMAFLSQSLTFNPFIERAGGLVLGIVMGFPQFLYMAVWQAKRNPAALANHFG